MARLQLPRAVSRLLQIPANVARLLLEQDVERETARAPADPAPPAPAPGETPLQRAERISEERFTLISSIYQQSEAWKKAFQDQAAAHAEGQYLLESRLEQIHVAFRRAVQQINDVRRQNGLDQVEVTNELLRDPAGVAKSYRDRMVAIGLAAQAAEDKIECPGTGKPPAERERDPSKVVFDVRDRVSFCPCCGAQVGLAPGNVVARHHWVRTPAAP